MDWILLHWNNWSDFHWLQQELDHGPQQVISVQQTRTDWRKVLEASESPKAEDLLRKLSESLWISKECMNLSWPGPFNLFK